MWTELNTCRNVKQYIYDTGQHYDDNMSKAIIKEFGFKNILFGEVKGLSPQKQIPKMIEHIWGQLDSIGPDYALIYGDTNSTLSASIACSKSCVPYGHVEAGVITAKNIGIQEGINRKIADQLATHNFCVTKKDFDNLMLNGSIKGRAFLVGDLMSDAYKFIKEKFTINAAKNSHSKKSILVTIHRAENIDDDSLRLKLIKTLSKLSNDYKIILPLHPRLKLLIKNSERDIIGNSDIDLIQPLTYSEIVKVLNNVVGVVTDSGGLPKDAAYAGIKSIVLREDPVWHELFDKGYIEITKDIQNISIDSLVSHITNSLAGEIKPYMQDSASKKIVPIILRKLKSVKIQ